MLVMKLATRFVAPLAALIGFGTSAATAADFTATPDISGGFGSYRWDIAIGAAAAVGNPNLLLLKGQTYTFDINTTAIHPFWIKTTPSTGSLNAYAGGGLSANGVGTATTITFVVPTDAPDTLYYNRGNHREMTGTITLILDSVFANGFE